jgi:hypothetical protein
MESKCVKREQPHRSEQHVAVQTGAARSIFDLYCWIKIQYGGESLRSMWRCWCLEVLDGFRESSWFSHVKNYKLVIKSLRPRGSLSYGRFKAIEWPSTGGLCVNEFEVDSNIYTEYIDEDLELNMMLIRMARTMDEKCTFLSQKFRGKYYFNVSESKELELLNFFNENSQVTLPCLKHFWSTIHSSFLYSTGQAPSSPAHSSQQSSQRAIA